MDVEQVNRAHRAKQAGSKAARQARRKKKKNLGSAADEKRHNPKAFTFSGGVISVQRKVQHSLDKATAKEHKPVVDKTPAVAPPFSVVVQGPPGVGKSLLIRCLARHYARRTIGAIRGPVTVVASKQRRLTFLECPNDACGMLDAAKIADIALVLIDAQYGFEMETFEFINMLQTHGMPRVIGVLTHLDAITDKTTLKRRKKELKARFWSELYDGAKLFFLSGLRNGKYHNRDILNLARFVSVQKVRPLQWRAAHPYLLALKADTTDSPSESKNDLVPVRSSGKPEQQQQQQQHFVLYGYVRGAVLRAGHSVHIPGAGDFPIVSITKCEDPCPAPRMDEYNNALVAVETQAAEDAEKSSPTPTAAPKRRRSRAARSLKEKQRYIFAPYCDIGGLTLDDDTMYIHLPDTKVGFTPKAQLIEKKTGEGNGGEEGNSSDNGSSSTSDTSEREDSDEGEEQSDSEVTSDDSLDSSTSDADLQPEEEEAMGPAVRMVRQLQGAEQQLTKQLQSQKLQLLDTSTRSIDVDAPPPRRTVASEAAAEASEHLFFDGELGEEGRWDGAETDTDSSSSASEEAAGGLALQHIQGSRAAQPSLGDLVYGGLEADAGGPRGARKENKARENGRLSLFEDSDGNSSESDGGDEDQQDLPETKTSGKKFFYGNLPLPASGLSPEIDSGDAPNDEAAAIYKAMGIDPDDPEGVKAFWTPQRISSIKRQCFITGGWQELEEAKEQAKNSATPSDQVPTDDQDEQRQREEQEQRGLTAAQKAFEDSEEKMGGFAIGTYVQICIANLPQQWLSSLDPSRPILVGGISAGETQCTFMQIRIRKHRWSPRILKSSDPLLFSAGWRRFQSLPVYAMEDRGETRVKYLKYTPEHLHCLAYIYTPALPPSTPFLAIRDTRAIASYRIAASGVVLQSTPEPRIEKKLKLIGEAKKIFKNTAFIKGMFNSDLEVNRCIGARIQTASGIRGQIKKALGTDGTFRASFEDKILMSDLVICKTWIAISPRPFFNPVLDVAGWRRLRTQAEIRQAKELPLPYKGDNLLPYGGQPRVERKFNPIRIPKQLAVKLPFHARLKLKRITFRSPRTYRRCPYHEEPAKLKEAEGEADSKAFVGQSLMVCVQLQAPTSRLRRLKGKKLQEEKDMQKPIVSAYDRRVAALLQRLQTIRNAREEQRKKKQQEKLKAKQKRSAKVEAERQRKQQQIRKKRHAKKGKIEMGMRKRLRLGTSNDE